MSKIRAVKDLTAGHKSAVLLRQCLLNDVAGEADSKLLQGEQLITVLLERIILSFENSIAALDCVDHHHHHHQSELMSAKLEDSSGESSKPSSLSVRKGRRGCYKRRKGSQTWTKVVSAILDDGQTWRKYGQKVILNTPFPRSYFRCTHKKDQGCLATKQVQQTQTEPPMYTVTYDGHHTCTNSLKSASLFVDLAPGPDQSSSVMMSFNSAESNQQYHGCTLLGSSDYILQSPEFGFEGMSSNSSSHCSYLDQGMEFLQHEDGPVGMCVADFEDLLKSEFEF
ncbi:unnamed protein product [Rhodiola kirilowii]